MVKVCIVAYYFPPDGGAGSQRPLKFAKYLSQHGHQVSVVTHDVSDAEEWMRPKDVSLDEELANRYQGSVVRVRDRKVNVFPQIDSRESWSIATIDPVCELIDQGKVDAVIYTMSPFSLARSAAMLRKKRPSIPIIVDFRDPWALDGWQPQKTALHWLFHFNNMKAVIELADGVIVNTPECGILFPNAFPKLAASKIEVITNGYDAEDFSCDPGLPTLWKDDDKSCLRLVYSGALLDRSVEWSSGFRGLIKRLVGYSPEKIDYSGRTLQHILSAIERLRELGDPIGKRIRIDVIGMATKEDINVIERSGAFDAVHFHGYISHKESVRHIRLADALLLLLHGLPQEKRSRIVPGKTYEYMATGRPILGLLPEGDARDFVLGSGRGVTADPCSVDSIVAALRKLQSLVVEFPIGSRPSDQIQEFERNEQCRKLLNFVSRILNRTQ